ncbi:MAG: asparagine synthase-related protein [Candidatus Bathyarchaeia archaeon]
MEVAEVGAVAAAVSKSGDNVVPRVIAMLNVLKHRGADFHGVATPNLVILAKFMEEMRVENVNSSVALGYNLSRILEKDCPQPVQGDGFTLVFEGRLFPPSVGPDGKEFLTRLRTDPLEGAERAIKELDGSYVFAIALPGRVVAGRDPVGVVPLYYGENEDVCALASERKALWRLGMENVKTFPPGTLAVVNAQGFSFKPTRTIEQLPLGWAMEMDAAAVQIQGLLLKSVRGRTVDIDGVAVAFSGGLDSSLIAALAKICGVDAHLISVSMEGQPDIQFTGAAAEALGLPLQLQTYTVKDVEKVLPRVLWLIEEPSLMKAAIAIPLYWAAEIAARLGYRVLLAGQGGDELFGGYHRYLQVYRQGGVEAVQTALYRDVIASHETNFQRDYPVCAFHGVELRLPFTDLELVRFSLGLPVNLKIISEEDRLRKRALRRVAQLLGLSEFIFNRPKRAVQYATGVDKALRRLAKDKGLAPQEYVRAVFRETRTEEGV